MYSPRVQEALTLSALRHAGQLRKLSGASYLTHPVHVARIVAGHGYDEDHEIVALLHDVLEDTCKDQAERDAVRADIAARFGEAVARAIDVLSEPKRTPDGAHLHWTERKKAYISQLEGASEMALVVSAADKVHNLATLCKNLEEGGPELWSNFRGGPEESLWFYSAVRDVVARRLPGAPIAEELEAFVAQLVPHVEAAR